MFSKRPSIRCRELTLSEVRAAGPIPSGYQTDRIFRFERHDVDGGFAWSLIEESLPHPFSKSYDGGNVDQWLLSYEDAGPISKFRFFGAIRDGEMFGLATCSVSEWNSALWLVDIRVRESSRRSGVGSALIESVVELCREEQLRGVLVETQNRNHPAVCFYRRHGFQISGFNDHLYSNEDIANQDVAVYFFLKV